MASRGSLSISEAQEASLSYILYAGLWHPATEKKILRGHVFPGRLNEGKNRCLSLSFLPAWRVLPSASYRESRYRFRISERRCKARGIHVFLNERNVDANGRSRISITSAWNEALSWNPRTTRAEPSFIPFRECHGERKKKSGTSTIHQEHFDARWKRSDFPLVRILYRRDRRGSFDMCVWKFNSIDPRVNPNDARPIIGIMELSWIYRGLIVAPSRIRRTETWKGRNDTRTGSSIILEKFWNLRYF